MKFDVYGPYKMPRDKRIISIDKEKRRKFWDDVNHDHLQLSKACGCYAFLIGTKAWYIGKTDKSFEKECFQPHKTQLYAAGLQKSKTKPYLILIASLSKNGKFRKTRNKGRNKNIDLLERLLIFAALQHNKKLLNGSNTAKLRRLNVPGFTNSRRGQGRATAVQALKKAIGLQ